MRTCLGGTFDPFHVGHEALLRTAADGASAIFVGITEGELALRPREVAPVEARRKRVDQFLRTLGFGGPVEVQPIRDAAGPARKGDYDRIVVSPETRPAAERINRGRRADGLKPLVIQVAPHVLGDDRLPVSGTAIAEGRVDRAGKLLRPIRIGVGSANPVKVEAVRQEMEAWLGQKVDVVAAEVPSGVPEQPILVQALDGARNRARALRRTHPEADYAIGIEAGLVRFEGAPEWYDAQACHIIDRTGWATEGWGPAFAYPGWVNERVLKGEMVSSVLGPVAADPRIGSTTGAIGYLSDGRLDRVGLTRLAVAMALVPRTRRSLYVAPV